MNLLAALTIGVLFGSGIYMMMREDVAKLAAGTLMLGNSAILLLVSVALGERGVSATTVDGSLADPLGQALALTAVVINFGTTVLLSRIMVAVERTHHTLDTEKLMRSEVEDEARIEGKTGDAGDQDQ